MNEFPRRLKRERERRSWSQEQLAARIGTTAPNVGRWERGQTSPGPHFRQQLCAVLDLDAEVFGFLQEEAEQELIANTDEIATPWPVFWNIPYRRNPFFTGRDEVFTRLHERLHAESAAILAQVQAISGLGGIGKTSTAIEYAYRYRKEYQMLLWTHAENHEMLAADAVNIAQMLGLPEKDEQDLRRVMGAVKRWLDTHEHWLLILDNVEDFSLLNQMLPSESKGHVLITTRAQATGLFAQRIDLERMEPDEGVLFLLRRAKIIPEHALLAEVPESRLAIAREIFVLMDGLPLALDQAGAYIEETGCSLSEYLDRYRNQSAMLLNMRGVVSDSHPQSVSATVSLAVEKLVQVNPVAAKLLEFCAFLHPDAIPEEILIEGAPHLGSLLASITSDPCKRDTAIAALRQYSLVRRNLDTKTLTIHRLVQAVVKDRLSEEKQRQWAERAVRAVNQVLPKVIIGSPILLWQRFQRYILHAQACTILIEQWDMISPSAWSLLGHTGNYLHEGGQYAQAERLLQKAFDITMSALGPEHPDVAQAFHALAILYWSRGKYTLAEPLLQQALAIREKVLGPEHPDVAQNLNDLALVLYSRGQFVQAELLYKRSLDSWKHVSESNNLSLEPLHNLGVLYLTQCQYAQAEQLLTLLLHAINEIYSSEDLLRAYTLDHLAMIARERGNYSQAEELFQQAFSMSEQLPVPGLITIKISDDWSRLCYLQGKYLQGERLCYRAIAICEQIFGVEYEHPLSGQVYTNLAMVLLAQGKDAQAELFAQRALMIREHTLGPEHHKVARSLTVLANMHHKRNENIEAEALYRRALKIYKRALGPENSRVAEVLNGLALVLLAQQQYIQAEEVCLNSLQIREKICGERHPYTAHSLHTLGQIAQSQEHYEQAETYYQRALNIQEQTLGPAHPDRAATLEHYADVLIATQCEQKATCLLAQAQEIRARHADENA